MEMVIVCGVILFAFVLTVTWGYTAFVEAAAALTNAHAWLIEKRTKWHLARHGLSNEQVVGALMELDQFTFYMWDGPCVCIKGPDGRHEFVLPRESVQSQFAAAAVPRREGAETVPTPAREDEADPSSARIEEMTKRQIPSLEVQPCESAARS